MPEWSNGPDSKSGVRASEPGVRIPLSPHSLRDLIYYGEVEKLWEVVISATSIS